MKAKSLNEKKVKMSKIEEVLKDFQKSFMDSGVLASVRNLKQPLPMHQVFEPGDPNFLLEPVGNKILGSFIHINAAKTSDIILTDGAGQKKETGKEDFHPKYFHGLHPGYIVIMARGKQVIDDIQVGDVFLLSASALATAKVQLFWTGIAYEIDATHISTKFNIKY